MNNLIIVRHPLVQRDLALLRNRRTPSNQFRSILRRLSILMAYEVTRNFTIRPIRIDTPLERTKGVTLDRPVILVAILRAGLGMVGGFAEVLPDARVGHIGMFRDEQTLRPVDYYFKVPRNLARAEVLLLDPMLATGGSAAAAISYLKERGCSRISLVSIVAAPEGVRNVRSVHPDVPMFTCALDRKLNHKGYILPGLGDAGDRIFGTN
jgi:uracil phosphoribosyltransferase